MTKKMFCKSGCGCEYGSGISFHDGHPCEWEEEDHDCHLSPEDGCDCGACKPKYQCELCKDTGEIEIMGGSEADEWGVVDIKPCTCQED